MSSNPYSAPLDPHIERPAPPPVFVASRKIGGWLILVAIGTVIGPIKMLGYLGKIYNDLITKGSWAAVTTEGSAAYNALAGPFIVFETLLNVMSLAAGFYLIFLFFGHRKRFVKWYVWTSCLTLLFIVTDLLAARAVWPGFPMFDADTTKEFSNALFAVFVWVPYMLMSKRVAETFTR